MGIPLPEWLQRILGIGSRPGQGIQWTIEHAWPWPGWLSVLIVLLLVGLIVGLYWRETRAASRNIRTILALCRLLLVGLVFWMISQSTLVVHRTGLPYLVLLLDNSGSMSTVDGYSAAQAQALRRRMKDAGLPEEVLSRLNLAKMLLLENDAALLRRLHREYQVRIYVLEDSVGGARPWPEEDLEQQVAELRRLEPTVPSSRLGAAVQSIFRDLRGTDPAAVVLFTDGITTEGPLLSDVASLARRRGVPIWAVGLGDDRPLRNIKLADLVVEPVVFVDDLVPFECHVSATGLEGRRARLVLRQEGTPQILAQTEVVLGQDGQLQTARLLYRPSQEGTFRYQVQLEPLEEEFSHDDNQRSCTLQVRKERIRVLLAQAQPDYEFRYLSNLLRRDPTVELRIWLQEADPDYVAQTPGALRIFPVRPEELFEYDVIILGDVPPTALGSAAMEALVEFVQQPGRGGAIVFIAGPRGWMPQGYRGTPLERLLPFDLRWVRMPPPDLLLQESVSIEPTELGLLSPSMQLGDTAEQTRQIWRRLPPLRWLLEIDQVYPGVRVLAAHPTRTGSSGNRLPVILLQYVGAGQVLFHATDETWRWRWRLGDTLLARYWIQTLRTLSRAKLAQGGRWAELTTDRRQYQRGEPVRLRVLFSDPRQAPEEDRAVCVVLEHPSGRSEQLLLERSGLSRGLFEKVLPALSIGEYYAWLSAPRGEGPPPSTNFQVVAPPAEMSRLQMDLTELRRAAQTSQGRLLSLADVHQLLDDLPPGRQVPLETLPPVPLWNRWPLLALFLSLLVAEWILRKYYGMV
ncbi:MAG: VWA domain-containing protein [Thermoguttaceae bacterium]|nr:VWA domain-containing protein [Thermoguttaceae bacterium]MDW8038516.1 vWA domain-containing protein [Thermoguttaceae bacterium]